MKPREAMLLLAVAWFLPSFSADRRSFVPFAGFLGLGYFGMRAMEWPGTRRLFLPVVLAAWAPALAGLFFALALLLHLEDG